MCELSDRYVQYILTDLTYLPGRGAGGGLGGKGGWATMICNNINERDVEARDIYLYLYLYRCTFDRIFIYGECKKATPPLIDGSLASGSPIFFLSNTIIINIVLDPTDTQIKP